MRSKSKDECESHYMKNFINNPLFSSTLLSLRQIEESRSADGAIPFKRTLLHTPTHAHTYWFRTAL